MAALGALRAGVLYDGSEPSGRAVDEAVLLLGQHEGAHIIVLTVCEQPPTDPPFGFLPDEAATLLVTREAAARQLQEMLGARLRATPLMKAASWSLVIEVGEVRSVLVDWVRRERLRLLFVGTRGLSGVQSFFLGSTSQHALQHAPCSVVVVK